MQSRTSFSILSAALVGVILVGCSASVPDNSAAAENPGFPCVNLVDPTVPLPEEWTAGAVADALRVLAPKPLVDVPRLSLRRLVDARPDLRTTADPEYSDVEGYGAELGSVDLQGGVALRNIFSEHLRSSFAASGLELIPGHDGTLVDTGSAASPDAYVEVEIQEFYVVYIPRGPGINRASMSHLLAAVEFEVVILDPDGMTEHYRETFGGKEMRSWEIEPPLDAVMLRSIHEATINRAHHEAMADLIAELRGSVSGLMTGS